MSYGVEEAMRSDKDQARADDFFEGHQQKLEDVARCLAKAEHLMETSRDTSAEQATTPMATVRP